MDRSRCIVLTAGLAACAVAGDDATDSPGVDAAMSPSIDAAVPDAPVSDAAMADAVLAVDAAYADAASSECGPLVAYYRFEDDAGDVVDSSGCGHHGTAFGVSRGEAGKVGSAFRFDGSTAAPAYVSVLDAVSLSSFERMTIEAWVFHTGGAFEAIASHGNGMGGDPYAFHTYSAGEVAFTVGGFPTCAGMVSVPAPGATPLPDGTWVHVATSFDSALGEAVFFVNGERVGAATAGFAAGLICDNDEPLLIGALRTDGTWSWQGLIDELKIWRAVRTDQQICEDAGGTYSAPSCVL